MGYGHDGLTFNSLRGANKARLPQFQNCHGEPAHSEANGCDWSPAQWLQAVVGELGEYANLRKKFERGDIDRAAFEVAAAIVVHQRAFGFTPGAGVGSLIEPVAA